MISRRLAVIGAGGHAKVVVAAALAAGFEVVGILDDAEEKWGTALLGLDVLGPVSALKPDEVDGAVVAVGNGKSREAIARKVEVDWMTIIHPDASVHTSVIIGPGSVVFAGAVVQPDVRLGHHVIINTGATVDHESQVGNYTHIAPGANVAGNVRVGNACLIGIGSAVAPGVEIGDGAVLGAGSVAVRDIGPGVVAVGVPAIPLEQ